MRIDFEHIVQIVEPNSRVLDVGCGDGELLAHLANQKNVVGYGIEKDPVGIQSCVERGVNIIEHDLNFGLARFPADSFDSVVMTETLQALDHPIDLLRELLRVAKRCIVTFPNMGHWRCRLQLLTRGRMPVSEHLPYEWYDTPNIHLCTFKDFDALCEVERVRVVERSQVNGAQGRVNRASRASNLLATTGLYVLERAQ